MRSKSRGKPGASSVMPSAKGSNPAANSGGNPGRSMPQRPIPGPEHTGQPPAMKKALARKSVPGGDVTGFPGLVR